MMRARGLLTTFVATMVGAGALIAPAPAASAATSSAAAAGVCTTSNGTTVVVDMTALGGDIIVRCATGSGFSGLDALKKAGFSVTGTAQSGLAYVCRIQGRPSATETLPVKGKPDYKEACRVTPPTTAYWSYWYAKNGGSWTYASTGASGHAAIKGGFEGWAFSLNRAGNPPKPGYAPNRPKAPAQPAPTTSDPTKPPSDNGGGGNGGGGNNGSGSNGQSGPTSSPTEGTKSTEADGDKAGANGGKGDGAGGKKQPGKGKGDKGADTPESTAPTDGAVTTATGDSQVTGELPPEPTAAGGDDGSGSSTPTLIGLGLLVLLGGGAGITAWRRSHRG